MPKEPKREPQAAIATAVPSGCSAGDADRLLDHLSVVRRRRGTAHSSWLDSSSSRSSSAACCSGLYVVFEEVSRRESSLRIRLSSGPRPDMTSVWNLAAAVVLPLGYAVVLITVLRGASLVSASARHAALRGLVQLLDLDPVLRARPTTSWSSINRDVVAIPDALTRALVIGLAILTYTTVNRLLVYVAYGTLARPQRPDDRRQLGRQPARDVDALPGRAGLGRRRSTSRGSRRWS